MEDTRRRMLNYIERNCKVDEKELAVLLGIDEAVVKSEIGAMEQENIICGYHTMIDWDKAGVEKVNALIEVRVTPQRGRGFEKIAERIYNYPEVSSVSLISGAYDFLVTIEGKSLMEVSRFVSEKLSPIDEVVGTATHFILKKYKDHGTILAQKEKEERMLVIP
ncbi:MAG: Lrp/AsnC family transcriptional regulator [Dorea sp.]|nr:Lrp/AsnC family transcriptional regulator [Dorea sp.]